MTHLFDRRDYWGNRLSVWVVVLMAFAAPLCCWSLQQIRLADDVESWLSDRDPEVMSRQWVRQQFSIDEQVLLTWDDSSLNDARIPKLVEALTGQTDGQGVRRGGSPYVSSVIEPVQELITMQGNGIEPQEAVRRLQGTVIGMGPLRVRLSESGRAALRKTRHALQTGIADKFDLQVKITDPTAELLSQTAIPTGFENGQAKEPSPPAILSADGQLIEAAKLEYDLQLTWKGLHVGGETTLAVADWLMKFVPDRGGDEPLVESVFFAPGSPVALLVGLTEAGLADKAETIAAIRAACGQAGIPDESVHLAGAAVTAAELKSRIVQAIWNPAYPAIQLHKRSPLLASLLMCAAISIGLLRNIRLVMLTLGTALFSTCAGLAMIPLLGGSINLFLVTLPTLMLGLTLAGAIHVANYWRIAANRHTGHTIAEMTRMSWTPIILGSLATAIGFAALCGSSLLPVRDFGRFAALGCIATMVMLTFGLPSLLQLWKANPKAISTEQSGWRLFGQMLTVRSGLQSYAIIAICIGCGMGLNRYQAESGWTQLLPGDSRINQDNWFFESHLSGVTPLELVVLFDQQSQRDANFVERLELIRKVQEKIRQHPAVSGTTSAVDLQPVSQAAPENASFLQRTKLNKQASAIEQQFRDGEAKGSRRFHAVASADSSLDAPSKSQIGKPGDEMWRITAHVAVMNGTPAFTTLAELNAMTQDVLKLQPGSQHLIAGDLPMFERTQMSIKKTLTGSFILSLALVFGVLLVALRGFGAALITMIAQLAPFSVVFGLVSWLKQPMEIGSLIAAPISLGIAAFGTIHFLAHVRAALQRGKPRREAMIDALVDCGSANFQAVAVAALPLLAFLSVELPSINHLSWMTAAMIGVGLMGNSLLLPLLVSGPFGRLFEGVKITQAKPILAEEPVATLETPAIATVIPETPVPEPHIKPHETPKKRRSSARRDRDAG